MALIPCRKCGALVSDKADACPVCNTPLNEEEVTLVENSPEHTPSSLIPEEKRSFNAPSSGTYDTNTNASTNRKLLFGIMGGILIIVAIIGCFFIFHEKEEKSVESIFLVFDENNAIKEKIKERIESIYAEISSDMYADTYNFMSEEFRNLDSEAGRLQSEMDAYGEYSESNIWTDSQDHNELKAEVSNINLLSEEQAEAYVKVIDSSWGVLTQKTFVLVKVGEDWLIDDFIDQNGISQKQTAKSFIERWQTDDSQSEVETFQFSGMINEKYPIEMTLTKKGSHIAGVYHYTKTGSGADLKLEGTSDSGNSWEITETDANGQMTGTFIGLYDGMTFEGKFVNNKGKEMPFVCNLNRE